MADLTCPYCGNPAPETAPLCPTCGGPLLTGETGQSGQPGQDSQAGQLGHAGQLGQGGQAGEPGKTRIGPLPARRDGCPACGADIPDPGNLVCVECLEPLGRTPDRREPVAGTRRDRPRTLLLDFPGGRVTVPPGGTETLGRDPAAGGSAQVFQRFENISRRHATLGVDPGGSAWIRDENSTNGTFVNGVPIRPGARTSLHDGDLLRLAADVEARVRLRENADG
ncbi:hypothetical protein Acor_47230 [Acrocarpospora corrugata]|uniref:FHA domain-containing protein n=1 Tax=Acrocarpospora corrugata TaxID=35763 RepID=A0A5M3W0L4_9ACTN|nr:FHA domain-containing protein [Acrocarpospora corrugata]GES02657.1 hypothetical protein Acor_47230 [Acrocarpospora corrugata]